MAANRRKILVPLATLTVAGAVAVGSGASFTSTTASTTAVSSGVVSHSNDVTSLAIENIKDGDTITGSVTVTNTGTLPSTLTLAQTGGDSTFVPGDLLLTLSQDGAVLWTGDFASLDQTLELGEIAADPDAEGAGLGGSATVDFSVTLDETDGIDDNTNENKDASASFTWVSTQLEGDSIPFLDAFDGAFGIGE